MPARPTDHTTDPLDDVGPDPVLDAAMARAVADLDVAVHRMPVRSRSHAAPRPARRRVRAVLAIGLAVTTAAAAAGVIYLRTQADQLHHVHVDGLAPVDASAPVAPAATTEPGVSPGATVAPVASGAPATTTAPPAALTQPVNLLVVGLDTRTDGTVLGTRSDTIAIVRMDPGTGRVAVLSIPRDLWVSATIDGSTVSRRINSLLADGDPSVLVATIASTFGIDINHYVAIDFAGFQDLIDLAGGVDVPFETAVRDSHTGFIAEAGCQHLDGGQALAYVRARYLERLDATSGTWKPDPLSDLSRIARQQDLVRRMYTAILAADYGVTDQFRILTDVVDDITVDDGLDLDGVRALFATARSIGSAGFVSYSLADVVRGKTIAGNAVLVATDGLADIVDRFLHGDRTDPSSPVPSGAIVPVPTATC